MLVIAIGSTGLPARAQLRRPVDPVNNPAGNSPADRAWAMLESGLNEKDAENRRRALSALATIQGAPRAVTMAERGLKDKNLLVRQAAASALGDMSSLEAIPQLRQVLYDESPEVDFTAAKSLWNLGDRETADQVLWQVMRGERKDAPTFGEGAKRQLKKEFKPAEIALMGAKEAAGLFGPAGMAIDAVTEGAKAAKQGAGAPGRVITAEILAKDTNPYSLQLLEWALNDQSWPVRVAVCKALGERGDPGSIDKLVPVMSDEHHAVRYMAAASIIRINAK